MTNLRKMVDEGEFTIKKISGKHLTSFRFFFQKRNSNLENNRNNIIWFIMSKLKKSLNASKVKGYNWLEFHLFNQFKTSIDKGSEFFTFQQILT